MKYQKESMLKVEFLKEILWVFKKRQILTSFLQLKIMLHSNFSVNFWDNKCTKIIFMKNSNYLKGNLKALSGSSLVMLICQKKKIMNFGFFYRMISVCIGFTYTGNSSGILAILWVF